ncbi:MAG TPA: hypothetical protein VIL20_18295 [Sandaracinaceae bacterium]
MRFESFARRSDLDEDGAERAGVGPFDELTGERFQSLARRR